MQGTSINHSFEPVFEASSVHTEASPSIENTASKSSFWTILRGSPKAFRLSLLCLAITGFSTGLGFTVFALAPDATDLERQEVLHQQFSAASQQFELIR